MEQNKKEERKESSAEYLIEPTNLRQLHAQLEYMLKLKENIIKNALKEEREGFLKRLFRL